MKQANVSTLGTNKVYCTTRPVHLHSIGKHQGSLSNLANMEIKHVIEYGLTAIYQ